jgi:hypothetical protein
MSNPTQIFFNNLLLDNNFNDFNEYYDYIISTSIDEQIILLSKISQQNNVTSISFNKSIRDRLILDIKANLNWRGRFLKLEPVYNYNGGYVDESDLIWPVIKNVFIKNGKELKFINNDENIIINIQNPFPSKKEIPLLGKGSFTAVYLVEMNHQNYILRITMSYSVHLLYDILCMANYNKYKDNLMEIILHGNIEFKRNNKLKVFDLAKQKNIPITNFKFNYILTKKYNVFSQKTPSLLTNKQKFDLVINLLELLLKMYEKKEFHADLKIENIGWNDKMEVILIDYDEDTIVAINTGYIYLKSKPDKSFHQMIKTSIIPPYINNIDQKEIEKYDMYSIMGVSNIIFNLKFKLLDNSDLFSIYPFMNLINKSYDQIPKYNILIDKLKELKDQIF